MNIVGIITFLSLTLLLMSLLLIYSQFQNKTLGKLLAIVVFFLLNTVSLVHIVYTEQNIAFSIDSIKLGSVFMIVWLITAATLFFGILLRVRVVKKDPNY